MGLKLGDLNSIPSLALISYVISIKPFLCHASLPFMNKGSNKETFGDFVIFILAIILRGKQDFFHFDEMLSCLHLLIDSLSPVHICTHKFLWLNEKYLWLALQAKVAQYLRTSKMSLCKSSCKIFFSHSEFISFFSSYSLLCIYRNILHTPFG